MLRWSHTLWEWPNYDAISKLLSQKPRPVRPQSQTIMISKQTIFSPQLVVVHIVYAAAACPTDINLTTQKRTCLPPCSLPPTLPYLPRHLAIPFHNDYTRVGRANRMCHNAKEDPKWPGESHGRRCRQRHRRDRLPGI